MSLVVSFWVDAISECIVDVDTVSSLRTSLRRCTALPVKDTAWTSAPKTWFANLIANESVVDLPQPAPPTNTSIRSSTRTRQTLRCVASRPLYPL